MKIAKPTKTIWVTKSGLKVNVRDMEDSHVVNTIRFLIKMGNAKKSLLELEAWQFASMFDSETMASDCADREAERLSNMDIYDFLSETCPTWEKLVDEAKKRNLKIEDLETLTDVRLTPEIKVCHRCGKVDIIPAQHKKVCNPEEQARREFNSHEDYKI